MMAPSMQLHPAPGPPTVVVRRVLRLVDESGIVAAAFDARTAVGLGQMRRMPVVRARMFYGQHQYATISCY